jgi:hypothetical protein
MTSGSEKEFPLGAAARAISEPSDLFTPVAEPIVLTTRLLRYPTGPAITLREPAGITEEEPERWDGLY